MVVKRDCSEKWTSGSQKDLGKGMQIDLRLLSSVCFFVGGCFVKRWLYSLLLYCCCCCSAWIEQSDKIAVGLAIEAVVVSGVVKQRNSLVCVDECLSQQKFSKSQASMDPT